MNLTGKLPLVIPGKNTRTKNFRGTSYIQLSRNSLSSAKLQVIEPVTWWYSEQSLFGKL